MQGLVQLHGIRVFGTRFGHVKQKYFLLSPNIPMLVIVVSALIAVKMEHGQV